MNPPSKKVVYTTASLGELIAAVYDNASAFSDDPKEISRLAQHALGNIMRRARAGSVMLSDV